MHRLPFPEISLLESSAYQTKQNPIVHQCFTRPEIAVRDYESFARKFTPAILSPEELRQGYDAVVLTLIDYEREARPVFSIPEVRRFFQALHREWPYAFYFLNFAEADLRTFVLCQLPSVEVLSEPGATCCGISPF